MVAKHPVFHGHGQKVTEKKSVRIEAGGGFWGQAGLKMRDVKQADCAFERRAEYQFFLQFLPDLNQEFQTGSKQRWF